MIHKDIELARLIGEPRTCLVRECDQKGFFEALSPSTGFFDRPPAIGTFVRPGSPVGYLTILRKYYHLLIPEGHHGIVTDLYITARKQRVEYGQPIFKVSPESEITLDSRFESTKAEAQAPSEGIPEGMFGVRSPTDGIFYRRPNPQSPPYVETGSAVSQGTILALVTLQ